ncbi:MAG TPA: mechanosensitive ion channel domain-containing protein [Gemmatimonadaceae bacterium]|nr:mechanosensitive ion channel domain-containing protein [Gemmatimonadaceae bacterium]
MDLSHRKQSGAVVLLVVLLALAGYGVYYTRPRPSAGTPGARRVPPAVSGDVDQTSLITVEQLLRLPTAPEERSSAQSALRLADQEIDLAFAQAVRQAAARPRANTPEARQIDARLTKARNALAADKAEVTRLTAEAAKASAAQAQPLADRLELAKAMATLDQDEVDDAQQDLIRVGGDPQARMQAMMAQHEAASKSSDSLRVVVTPTSDSPGLVHRLAAWQALDDKKSSLAHAKEQADSLAAALRARHDRMRARAASRLRDSSARALSHDSTTALVAATRAQALTEQSLTTLDQRVDNQHQLSDTYTNWMTVVDGQQRVVVNRMLRGVVALIAIFLGVVLLAGWTDRVTGRLSIDRRRAQTLHMVARVTLQIIGILLILLVIFGPPNNLGTFLGLAGAGLTVALKDFIVGFVGWFVLMGRDGIRIGDLVEINGVTGEVVELGMFHTVLLETGDWSGSGYPTGRRVTFANGFAIEGHYFNFSTTGQWMWDEVQIVVPESRDPYAVAESLQTEVEAATSQSAQQAEAEWKGSRRAPHYTSLTATPGVHLKPVPGGVEITVRYVTRMAERAEVRGRLYRTAMQLLGTIGSAPR